MARRGRRGAGPFGAGQSAYAPLVPPIARCISADRYRFGPTAGVGPPRPAAATMDNGSEPAAGGLGPPRPSAATGDGGSVPLAGLGRGPLRPSPGGHGGRRLRASCWGASGPRARLGRRRPRRTVASGHWRVGRSRNGTSVRVRAVTVDSEVGPAARPGLRRSRLIRLVPQLISGSLPGPLHLSKPFAML